MIQVRHHQIQASCLGIEETKKVYVMATDLCTSGVGLAWLGLQPSKADEESWQSRVRIPHMAEMASGSRTNAVSRYTA